MDEYEYEYSDLIDNGSGDTTFGAYYGDTGGSWGSEGDAAVIASYNTNTAADDIAAVGAAAEADKAAAVAAADAINKGNGASLGKQMTDALMRRITTGGVIDLAKAASLGLGVLAAAKSVQQAVNPPKVGYQGGIPTLRAVRAGYDQQAAPYALAGVRPGAGGLRYATDVQYTNPSGLAEALAAVNAQKVALDQANTLNAAKYAPPPPPRNYDAFYGRTAQQAAAQPQQLPPQPLARGGRAGRYLEGASDGMADRVPAQIDNRERAKLSHGEFVIPADVVSHLGNGNSDAGAQELHRMMARIRKARTGNPSQGRQIDPKQFTCGGLAAAYAGGGRVGADGVRGFATGDVVAPAGTVGTEQNLSSWAGPYVANMLAKGEALSNMPYTAYQGPLTAGPSELQQQAFGAAGALQTPMGIGQAADTAGAVGTAMGAKTYQPTSGTFDAATAASYMNPYLRASLDPQLAEARRQSEITQMGNAAKMTQAGAFGGSRQAILDAETQRNLGTNLANITGQGYDTAYNNALSQYNIDRNRQMQEGQFGANFGLQALQNQLGAAQAQGQLSALQNQTGLANLNAQMSMGGTQRDITQAGMTADQAQFAAERDNPYRMVQYQQSLLQGLPMTAQQYVTSTNPYAVLGKAADTLFPTTTPTPPINGLI